MSVYDRMMNIDRRIIYTLLFIIVFAIVIKPIGLPITISPDTQDFYDLVDALPEGSVVWLDTAYSPGSRGELDPMVIGVLHHAFSKGHKVIVTSMWDQGPQIAQDLLDLVAPQYDTTYGEDYVHIGYRPGNVAAVLHGWQSDINKTAQGVDHNGNNSLADLPLMQEVPKLTADYVDLIVVFETGSPGTVDYLTYVTEEQGIPLTSGIIAMSVPGMKPYLESGQYAAIIPGSRGAAEYEMLIGHPGKAVASQDAISAAALYAVLLILVGNIGYLFLRNE